VYSISNARQGRNLFIECGLDDPQPSEQGWSWMFPMNDRRIKSQLKELLTYTGRTTAKHGGLNRTVLMKKLYLHQTRKSSAPSSIS